MKIRINKDIVEFTPEHAAEAAELARAVNTFLLGLPERSCNVFLRRYWYAEPLEDTSPSN